MSTRKAIHCYLTDEAHEAWHQQAARLGVSLSALMETLATLDIAISENTIEKARRIDANNRRRGPKQQAA